MPAHIIELEAHTLAEAHAETAQLARSGMSGAWVIQALHDDGCRACETQKDADCRAPCQPDFVLMSYTAHMSFLAFDDTQRKARWN